jgi:hypothetical protein
VQTEILAKQPSPRLRVYAVWVSKLFTDARRRWDAAGLTDRRVVHLWDPEDASGGWLAGNVPEYDGPDWDTYLLFGPDATWADRPGPLRDHGSPVVDAEGLRQRVDALLRTSP